MWNAYLEINLLHPLQAAAVQFALLGTLGELLSMRVRARAAASGKRSWLPWPPRAFALKVAGWALLGIYIKFMFVTASAGVAALAGYLELGWLNSDQLLLTAFITSTLMNVMLGPSMIILHRLWDNAIAGWTGVSPQGWAGVDKAMATLIWLWIPLHTFTFTQPREVRIGIAAVLSLVLGVVMGFAARGARQRQPAAQR